MRFILLFNYIIIEYYIVNINKQYQIIINIVINVELNGNIENGTTRCSPKRSQPEENKLISNERNSQATLRLIKLLKRDAMPKTQAYHLNQSFENS